MMIRFLDLTLLLLMAFLLEADLSIEVEVGLPHGDPNQSESSEDEPWVLSLRPTSWSMGTREVERCRGESMDGLRQCFQDSPVIPSSVMITPMRGVQVQRLVNIMDVCAREDVSCTVGGGS